MRVFLLAILVAVVAAGDYVPSSGTSSSYAAGVDTYTSSSSSSSSGSSYSAKPEKSDYQVKKPSAGTSNYKNYNNNYGYVSPSGGSSYGADYTKYETVIEPYAFAYAVNDDYTYTVYSRSETGDDYGAKTGSYSVDLPDGTVQTVTYTADSNGYNAKVTYSKQANYVPSAYNNADGYAGNAAYKKPTKQGYASAGTYGTPVAYSDSTSSYASSAAGTYGTPSNYTGSYTSAY